MAVSLSGHSRASRVWLAPSALFQLDLPSLSHGWDLSGQYVCHWSPNTDRFGHLSVDSSSWKPVSWAAVINKTSPSLSLHTIFLNWRSQSLFLLQWPVHFLPPLLGLLSMSTKSRSTFSSTELLWHACAPLVINCFAFFNFLPTPWLQQSYKLLKSMDQITPIMPNLNLVKLKLSFTPSTDSWNALYIGYGHLKEPGLPILGV